jgi:hypothetical protein
MNYGPITFKDLNLPKRLHEKIEKRVEELLKRGLGSRKLITYPFHLLFFLHFSLKILAIPMGMAVFFASFEEKIAVQNLGTLFISCSLEYFFESPKKHLNKT